MITDIQNAMLSAGITPPPDIYIDSRLHRFDIDRRGDQAGWYCFHGDNIPSGSFGNWKTGQSETWCSKEKLSPVERRQYRQIIEATRKQRDQQKQTDQQRAASKALSIWQSCHVAPTDHPYLKRKGIQAHGVKAYRGSLVIPVTVEGEITSLQFIGPAGDKKFLSGGRIKGGHFLIGNLTKPDIQIYICEGFATGASLHEHTSQPVYISFNAKNLIPVARAVKSKNQDKQIIIAADNDIQTAGNPGLTEARKAAACIGAELIYPDFSNESFSGTDFNDYLTGGGVL